MAIGIAQSSDLENWTKVGEVLPQYPYEGNGMCAPGALVMLALTSPKLMGWIVLLVPVVIAPLILVGRMVRKLSRAAQDGIADSSGLAGETLNAIQTVQAFTLEALQSDRFSRSVEQAFGAAVRRTRARALLTALGVMLVFGAITFEG